MQAGGPGVGGTRTPAAPASLTGGGGRPLSPAVSLTPADLGMVAKASQSWHSGGDWAVVQPGASTSRWRRRGRVSPLPPLSLPALVALAAAPPKHHHTDSF